MESNLIVQPHVKRALLEPANTLARHFNAVFLIRVAQQKKSFNETSDAMIDTGLVEMEHDGPHPYETDQEQPLAKASPQVIGCTQGTTVSPSSTRLNGLYLDNELGRRRSVERLQDKRAEQGGHHTEVVER